MSSARRQDRTHILHPPVAFDILEQFGFIHAVIEGDVLEFEIAPVHLCRTIAFSFSAISCGRSITSKTRSKLTMEVEKSTGALAKTLQRAIELTEIRAEGDDGADGERALDDVPAAQAVDERRAHCADQPEDDEEGRADHRAVGCRCRARWRRARGSGSFPRWRARTV